MKLRRVRAVARKEMYHLLRDWRSLGLGIAIPMMLLFLFGYALTLDVDRVPLVVWDQSGSAASRDFISRFTGSRYFSLQGIAGDYRAIERAIDRRDALAALIIPPDFARRVGRGQPVAVQAILDGSDSNTATIALGYAEAVTGSYSRDIILQRLARAGVPAPGGGLEIRPRLWFNSDMVSRNYIFPGLISVIMMIISALLTSLTVAREWESGTMEQLIATPLTGPELLLGKLVPYFAIGILDLVLAVLVGEFAFQVPLRGSITLLVAMSCIFLVGALSLGLLISIVTRNQRMASQLAIVATMLPAFLLSGFIFPIENMPVPVQWLTHVITARYYVTIMRGIYLKDVGLDVLWPQAGFLALFGLMVIAVALVRFRKNIES